MPQINPLYLRPVVTYCMYYMTHRHPRLGRVPTDDEVVELARTKREFAGIPGDEIQLAFDRAKSNLEATARAMASLGVIVRTEDGEYRPE